MSSPARPSGTAFGRQLRSWRARARMSQLDLAARAEVSQRHVSFIETGRARPRADVVRRVSDALGIPLRDRNRLLEAAGLAATYPEVPLNDATVAPFRAAVERLLAAHDPFPAYVVDRWWDIVATNDAGRRLFPQAADGISNAVEAFLSHGGIRDMVVNFPEIASLYLRRLEAEVAESSDERLQGILARAKILLADVPLTDSSEQGDLVICPRLRIGDEIVGTVTMVARFGATREVTLDELRVELVFPADDAADAYFRRVARQDQLQRRGRSTSSGVEPMCR